MLEDGRLVFLMERDEVYRTIAGHDVPERLGPDPGEPPPSSWMPNEGARRMMTALDVYMRETKDETPAPPTPSVRVSGLAVSRGVHEGTARLCFTSADLEKVRPGDVLVAPLTSPAINVVLPILGAIVTDKGGALSHAAIVSREFGIPGVVGTRNATREIPDGARVRVDGEAGTVTVVG
jgi:pyruvate,water dikinase